MHIRFSSQLCEDVLSPEREKLRFGSETSSHVVEDKTKERRVENAVCHRLSQ